MPRLYWKDMDSDVGHLSPVDLLILAPLSRWSRPAEQNLNCGLNPAPPQMPEDSGTRRESQTVSRCPGRRPPPPSAVTASPLAAAGEARTNTCLIGVVVREGQGEGEGEGGAQILAGERRREEAGRRRDRE